MRIVGVGWVFGASLLLVAATAAAAPPDAKSAKKVGKASGTEAVVGTLLDDVDNLNNLTTGHTRELTNVKQRVDEIERRLGEQSSGQQAMKADVDALKADVAGVKQDTAAAKDIVDRLKSLSWLQPTFQIRTRGEASTNRFDLNSSINDKYVDYFQRIRLGFAIEPVKGYRAFVSIQDSRIWGQEASVGTQPSTLANSRNLDLHEGYLYLYDLFTPGLFVQAGRMEMSYGDEWQIGAYDWDNDGQVFDGVRLGYDRPGYGRIDLFATVINRQVGQPYGHGGDFYGLYGDLTYLKFMDIQLYGFLLDDATVNRFQRFGTIGARIVARPLTGLTVEGEAAVQFGKTDVFDAAGAVLRADHVATAYNARVMYQFQVPSAPTLGLFFSSASGDANPRDGSDVAWRPLFPGRHGKLGNLDLFAQQGVWDIGPTFRISPVKGLTLRMDYHVLDLSTDGGDVMAFGGTASYKSGGSRFVGHEFDLVAGWQATKYLALEAGYALFAPGDATRSATVVSATGATPLPLGGDLAQWGYLAAAFGF